MNAITVAALAVGTGVVVLFNMATIVQVNQTSNQVSTLATDVQALAADVKSIQSLLYYSGESVKLSAREVDCLTKNVFYEAGIEDHAGKVSVAQVTVNRLNTKRWGNDVCSVVYAPKQFSWTLQRQEKPTGPLWTASKLAVRDYVDGIRVRGLEDTLFYHAEYINTPYWVDMQERVAQIGKHIFYNRARVNLERI